MQAIARTPRLHLRDPATHNHYHYRCYYH